MVTGAGYWSSVVTGAVWLLKQCGYWSSVVIEAVWLLKHCGY